MKQFYRQLYWLHSEGMPQPEYTLKISGHQCPCYNNTYEENIDEAINVIKKVNSVFEEKHKEKLRGKIEVLGVFSLNASGVTIRVIGRAVPLSQWEMERELRKDIKEALDKAGIEIPYPVTKVINK